MKLVLLLSLALFPTLSNAQTATLSVSVSPAEVSGVSIFGDVSGTPPFSVQETIPFIQPLELEAPWGAGGTGGAYWFDHWDLGGGAQQSYTQCNGIWIYMTGSATATAVYVKQPGVTVTSTIPNVQINGSDIPNCNPLLDQSGKTPYSEDMPPGYVTLIAPPTAIYKGTNYLFDHWVLNGVPLQSDLTTNQFELSTNTTADAVYLADTNGCLTVTIDPTNAVANGATWQVDGGDWQTNGATLCGLPAGDHDLSFSSATGFIIPTNQPVTIRVGKTTTVSVTYQPFATGSLRVTISPPSVTGRAFWQLDGGALETSGATLTNLVVGPYTVSFTPLTGWNSPANQEVNIASNQTTTITGSYVQQTGALKVTLTPPAAATGGAQWNLDGGQFYKSGVTLTNLLIGNHLVSFKTILGFEAPSNQTVAIFYDQTTTAVGAFLETNRPTITLISPTANLLVSNALFTATGKAADKVGVVAVHCVVNGTGQYVATSTNNWTNWSAAGLELAPGTNTLQAWAVNTGGVCSLTNTVKFIYIVSAPLSVSINGSGTVSPDYNGAMLQIGKPYSMTARAASGFAFTNWTGSITTNGATLKFLMESNLVFTANFHDIKPPTLTVAYPTLEENVSNAVITATGKAVDNVAVSNVFCALNGSDWFVASSTNKWTNWFASGLDLRPGSNNFQAWAMDTSGNCSPTDTVKFVYVVSAPLSVSINGSGTVSPDYNGAMLQIGKPYSMTARAASGFAFTNWTGSFSTNSATLKFMMESNLAFTANFHDIKPPTLTVAYPTLEENVSNAVITATGKAVDNVAVSNVFCALNGSDWFVASSTNKWTNWFASGLNLRPGSNNFQAWAMDTSGNCSPTDTVKFVYIVSAPLSVSINGSGTISPDYNGAILQIGKDYSMTARAASGFAFTGWTGSIVTNSATLKFMMESNLAFTANFRDTISPTLTITYPAANQRVSNAVATVTGKAGDNVGVAGVWYQLNGEGWNPAATTNHYTNWTSPVLALAQGTNIVSAFAADAAGNVSLTNTVKFVCTGAVVSSVFPIVTNGTDTSASVAFDGTNYLVGIQGDYVSSNAYQITAQMFGPAGQTIGARISPVPGHTGGNPAVACSGANYLMVWPDDYLGGNNSSLCGQIVSPLGALVGSWFPITTNSAQNRPEAAYGSGEYLVVWEDYSSGNNWAIYGQLVSLTGALVGSEMLICAPTDGQDEKGGAVAFDGANFLVVWQLNSTASGDHNVTYGVFVSPSGTMGTPFAIGQTVSRDRNPLNLVFNGTDYFVVWNYDSEVDNEGNPIWSLYGRFVSPAGGFSGNEFAILTNGVPRYPALAFDGVNYLLCWNQGWATANSDVQFQYLNSSGRPFGSQFTPFSAQGNQLPLLASLLFDGKRFVAVATLSAGAFTPSPTDNADVYGAFIPEPDTSADWAPDSLSGWEANINVTEPQAKQFDTSFGGDTFAQFGSGTNWENYGVGTYAYTKLASNVAQIGLTYTEPTYGTNSTVVDLTFTSKTSVTFTYVSTDNTGSGAMTLSRLTNSVQIPSVRMNASTTSSAGNGTNAGTYDPNGTFSMASGGWGTFTVAQYSPVARLRILNFSDPGEAGLILYNQTQFATPTSGDYFIQIFTDTNSPPVYTDVGTFTANDDWAPVSLAGFTATLTNGITMSWGDDTFAQFGSDTNIYEYGVGTNSYAKIGTNAARVVSFFIAPPTDADIYPSNATVSTITFTSPSTANFSWKNLSGSGSGTGTFTGVTNTAPASLAGKTVYFTESGENGYTTAVFGDQTATFTDPNATVSSGPYTYMAVSPIAGMLQITWTSGDNAGDTGYAEISFTSSMAGGFFHADYGTNGTLAKVGIGTFTMP